MQLGGGEWLTFALAALLTGKKPCNCCVGSSEWASEQVQVREKSLASTKI